MNKIAALSSLAFLCVTPSFANAKSTADYRCSPVSEASSSNATVDAQRFAPHFLSIRKSWLAESTVSFVPEAEPQFGDEEGWEFPISSGTPVLETRSGFELEMLRFEKDGDDAVLFGNFTRISIDQNLIDGSKKGVVVYEHYEGNITSATLNENIFYHCARQ